MSQGQGFFGIADAVSQPHRACHDPFAFLQVLHCDTMHDISCSQLSTISGNFESALAHACADAVIVHRTAHSICRTVQASGAYIAGVFEAVEPPPGENGRAQGAGQLRLRGDGERLAQRRAQARPPCRAPSPRRRSSTIGGVTLRPVIAATRVASDACTPATMSSGVTPEASSPMISVSANTTHMLLMTAGLRLRPASSPRRGQSHAQPRGQQFQKAAGAGGAAVVHHEVADRAVGVQPQELAVLPADVDDGPRIGHAVANAPGLAGDFGDRGVGHADQFAAVAGGHDRAESACGRCRSRATAGPSSASASASCSMP